MEMKNTPCLPDAFCSRMQEMLGNDYEAFLRSYENPRTYGLRVNTAKISCADFEALVPFPIKKIPWTTNGYFYEEESQPSRCIFYQAGLYYLQEPSAMTPASRLPIRPGDRVLDLCAAPGGKATAAAAALNGSGLLVANDISTSRARALLRNLELFGQPNIFVANEAPDKLTRHFPEYFDKIFLDAPCSGEGMFRKEEALARDWSPEKSLKLSAIQKELLLNAADMLSPGGMLLYSTCTFAPAENEVSISYLLRQRPDMELADMEGYSGFSPGVPAWGDGNPDLSKCVRIFPHRMQGEGHFLALLRKKGDRASVLSPRTAGNCDRMSKKLLGDFLEEIGLHTLGGLPFDFDRVDVRADKAYYLPSGAPSFAGIHFLRNGLYLGDFKKNRFEPAQPLALAIRKGEAASVISLPACDERLVRYLKGETLQILPGEASREKGWQLLCAEGYPVGFGKLVNGTLKNKYPAGWRV